MQWSGRSFRTAFADGGSIRLSEVLDGPGSVQSVP
jgi:hypothetical protein